MENIYRKTAIVIKLFLQYGCLALSFSLNTANAGELIDVWFDNQNSIVIEHRGCKLGTPLRESRKLIVPLKQCAASRNEIELPYFSAHKVHWAQHDAKTVWLVISFKQAYRFQTAFYPGQLLVCLPACDKSVAIKNTSKITLQKPQPKLSTLSKPVTKAQINNTAPDIVANASLSLLGYQSGKTLLIPIRGMLIDAFLARSIGYTPQDMVRDGLPHFGSKRDDWKKTRTRKHLGLDIYHNHVEVIAAADGRIKKIAKGRLSGLYIKLDHGQGMETLYIHLTEAVVKTGQKVRQGQLLGKIDGPAGNAVEPQLHFEIKQNGLHLDPLQLIKAFYALDANRIKQIAQYEKQLQSIIKQRNRLVKQFLRNQ
ncbi:M23 family metallopeptidase [Candidatus Venteria ishoeyi]|uniref:Murein DD-endopeptidase MepM n=1 Tax=Candidatus Venteria ishoeyi TaxID=1899563 RepID=A0A1H6FIQ3_9GAMM|nr:M23 family metallopeptidase [Candidatus Venteria ishoeyi]SEH08996.1 Murein DD-endopeptidase MepM [Candidatus Venteria ishoeyi]